MDKSRDNVTPLNAEVVGGAVYVRGDDAREVAPILGFVSPVHGVDHALRVGVAFVGGVGGA